MSNRKQSGTRADVARLCPFGLSSLVPISDPSASLNSDLSASEFDISTLTIVVCFAVQMLASIMRIESFEV